MKTSLYSKINYLLLLLFCISLSVGCLSSQDEIDRRFEHCHGYSKTGLKFACMITEAKEISEEQGTEKGLEACERIEKWALEKGDPVEKLTAKTYSSTCKEEIQSTSPV
jgi:hypothetical protein